MGKLRLLIDIIVIVVNGLAELRKQYIIDIRSKKGENRNGNKF